MLAIVGLVLIASNLAAWWTGHLALPAALSLAFLQLAALVATCLVQKRHSDSAPGVRSGAADGMSDDLSRFLEIFPDAVIIVDRSGNVAHANSNAREAFASLAPGSRVDLRFRDPEIRNLIARMHQTGQPTMTEYSEKGHIEKWYRVDALPLRTGNSDYALMFRDRSEMRRIDRMRADFVANASHELRTPLAAIKGFIETLRGPARNDPEARAQFLEIMEAQSGRMARLLDDLLSLSKLETRAVQFDEEPVELKGLLDHVIETLVQTGAESGVSIERDFGAGDWLVAGNRDELIQVFENLIENAIKYGKQGKSVRVSVHPAKGDGQPKQASISVADRGPGIPAEHLPRITERFYRVETMKDPAIRGTGLGLSIVRHIVARHKGELKIQSEVGKGSCFTVLLPLKGRA